MFGLFIFCSITILLSKYGTVSDVINKRLASISNLHEEVIVDEDMDKPLRERVLKPIITSVYNAFSKIVPTAARQQRQRSLENSKAGRVLQYLPMNIM